MNLLVDHLDMVMFLAAIVLLLRGFPVAFTLAGTGLLFALIGAWFQEGFFFHRSGEVFRSLGFLQPIFNRIFGLMDETNEVLVAVPLFVFMGVMLERSQVAGELLETMGRLFGTLRGGLGFSVTFVGMLLAASTGIVGATVVTMGMISLPSMMKHDYDRGLACGSIAAAGTSSSATRSPTSTSKRAAPLETSHRRPSRSAICSWGRCCLGCCWSACTWPISWPSQSCAPRHRRQWRSRNP